MSELIAKSRIFAIVGMGATGLSVARFLARQGERFVMLDTREAPAGLDAFKAEFPDVYIELGPLNSETLESACEIVVSPGICIQVPELKAAADAGIAVTGDIDLFSRYCEKPVIAITGSNAKSTVTTLVGEMAQACGINAGVGGNIGVPALDLLGGPARAGGDKDFDVFVLELSSFQLETTAKLSAKVACILNISPDHMDRYVGIPQYHAAKQRIYFGAEHCVINRLDPLTQPLLAQGAQLHSFAVNTPDFKQFGVINDEGQDYLAYGFKPLLPAAELKIKGRHNIENALSALAIGDAAGWNLEGMLEALKNFAGLEHRCQWLAAIEGVDYFNDSKGTNVGATVAAIDGLGGDNNVVLIAGGVAKGAEFSDLKKSVQQSVKTAVLIGEDAKAIAATLEGACEIIFADDLAAAVASAKEQAAQGDLVLLSPACASFDMFKSFEDRGQQFADLVSVLETSQGGAQ